MVRVGFVLLLLGIPGLIILPVGIAMIGIGGLLMVIGLVGNTAKAGAGVGKFAAKSVAHQVTTKACPECRSAMPRAAIVCLACGYRQPAPVAPAPFVPAPVVPAPVVPAPAAPAPVALASTAPDANPSV